MKVNNRTIREVKRTSVREAILVVMQLLESPTLIKKIASRLSPDILQLLINSTDLQGDPGQQEVRVAVTRFLDRVSEKKAANNSSTQLRSILKQVGRESKNATETPRIPFTWLRSQSAEEVAELLSFETERTIAIVVAHLGDLGIQVLDQMPDTAPSILSLVSRLDHRQLNCNVAEAIETGLRRRLQSSNSVERSRAVVMKSDVEPVEKPHPDVTRASATWKETDVSPGVLQEECI